LKGGNRPKTLKINIMFINGKRAVKVNAKKVIWGRKQGGKAQLYNVDGDQKWIPDSLCMFKEDEEFTKKAAENKGFSGDIPGTLLIEEWFYKKLFPNG